jgi:hypothetical protein
MIKFILIFPIKDTPKIMLLNKKTKSDALAFARATMLVIIKTYEIRLKGI